MIPASISMEELKTKFLNLYVNLPLNERKEVIVIIENEPITWAIAYIEISGNSPKGIEILQKLQELQIL